MTLIACCSGTSFRLPFPPRLLLSLSSFTSTPVINGPVPNDIAVEFGALKRRMATVSDLVELGDHDRPRSALLISSTDTFSRNRLNGNLESYVRNMKRSRHRDRYQGLPSSPQPPLLSLPCLPFKRPF